MASRGKAVTISEREGLDALFVQDGGERYILCAASRGHGIKVFAAPCGCASIMVQLHVATACRDGQCMLLFYDTDTCCNRVL